MTGSDVRRRLAAIHAEIGDKIAVLGVTKAQPIETIRAAVAEGLTQFGNNYAQEGEPLLREWPRAEWHFIGHIQSRKVKYLVDYHTVQSIDRLEIVSDLDKRIAALGRTLEFYVEVNIGDEAQKSGIAVDKLEGFLNSVAQFRHARLSGLMCMPPPLEPINARRPYFRRMRELFDRFRPTFGLKHLSMGTSADYRVAAEEGATMVRLGTTLFGERPAR